MEDDLNNVPRPPPRHNPPRIPRQAWTEETEISVATPPPSSLEGFLSPPNESVRIAQPNESASIEVRFANFLSSQIIPLI